MKLPTEVWISLTSSLKVALLRLRPSSALSAKHCPDYAGKIYLPLHHLCGSFNKLQQQFLPSPLVYTFLSTEETCPCFCAQTAPLDAVDTFISGVFPAHRRGAAAPPGSVPAAGGIRDYSALISPSMKASQDATDDQSKGLPSHFLAAALGWGCCSNSPAVHGANWEQHRAREFPE